LRFEVSDGLLTDSADVQVNITPNTAPSLGNYTDQTVLLGSAFTLFPDMAPSDNGPLIGNVLLTPGTFSGSTAVMPQSGEVLVSDAGPIGSYQVNVLLTDECDVTTSRGWDLEVVGAALFADGFESDL
jgi:hypothetical protein